jgi:hypothetical protein
LKALGGAEAPTDVTSERTLTHADLEAIADLVAAGLRKPGERWLTVDQVADLLGVSAHFVYTHQRLLGVKRLGEGKRAPLRFRHDLVLGGIERLSEHGAESPPVQRARAPRASARRVTRPALGGVQARPI